MKKTTIIFLIILIATIFVPMLSIIESNKSTSTNASKQMVTIFQQESLCSGIIDF